MTARPSPIVQSRRCRATGLEVVVEDTQHAASYLDPDDGRWATVCYEHGYLVNHDTLALARSHAVWPEWCPECQELLP